MEVFEGLRKASHADRSQFLKDVRAILWRQSGPGSTSRRMPRLVWRQGSKQCLKAVYDCVKAFSETLLRKNSEMTWTLIVHGDDDQIRADCQLGVAPDLSWSKRAPLKIYKGASMACAPAQRSDQRGLLAFIQS